jgi:SAM-dependent methyltransferase
MKRRSFVALNAVPICVFFALILVSIPSPRAVAQVGPDGKEKVKLDVPYEPSSDEVVAAMLAIAKVGKEDLVYDLGCGDGRIVIAAAQRTGARGVGVDLDPERIKESLENARRADVDDRVRFFQQDLFQTDIAKATVVMLYLWPEVNLKLRPKLLRELKPGTRVVSHSHTMGTWEPDRSVTSPDGRAVFFWVIPANVTGIWEWGLPGEKERYVMKISQQFQRVSGTLRLGPNEVPLRNLALKGNRLEFTVERFFQGQKQALRFTGLVRGDSIEGAADKIPANSQGKQAWKAERDPSSVMPLDS